EIVEAYKKVYEDIDCSEAENMNLDDDYEPVYHAEFYLNSELLGDIKKLLLKKYWVFYYTWDNAVYTSDNPILLKPHLKGQSFKYEGFGMRGVEVIFPISKNIILTIWDEDVFPYGRLVDNRFVIISSKELIQYNWYQYVWATDEVYAYKNDFSLIEVIKQEKGYINREVIMPVRSIKVNGK
ncbi:MAG TPA: DUF4238 domain-containing protein, partial [Emticicia sp.]